MALDTAKNDVSGGHLEFVFEFFEWDFVAVVFITVLFLDFFHKDACEVNVLEWLIFLRVASNSNEPFVSDGRLVEH